MREAYYDCDGDTLLFVVDQEGKGACHTGERTCFFRSFADAGRLRPMAEPLRPSPTEFAELAPTYTVVPVWREVLADLETPVSVFLKLVGGGRGVPARVGRARRAVGPVLVRRARPRRSR